MEATTKDLRLHTRELIAATHRGEEVTITFRGKPTARLVPLAEDADDFNETPDRNPGFGMWADHEGSVEDQVRKMRQGRKFD
jgi:prevent-host-death family protein